MDTTLLATHVTAAIAVAVLLGNVRRRPVTAELSASTSRSAYWNSGSSVTSRAAASMRPPA
jgi:hypothetical protein